MASPSTASAVRDGRVIRFIHANDHIIESPIMLLPMPFQIFGHTSY
jgi:hypothetical protein